MEAIFKSSGWKKIFEHLQSQHPVRKGLPMHATMEQRGIHQVFCQNYESILAWLEVMTQEHKLSEIPSTYEPEIK